MLEIDAQDTDAPEFIEAVRECVTGALAAATAESAFVVKIDNWFGPKWMGFSHKFLGALGVGSSDLVVPPFVPNRVVSETFLLRAAEGSLERAHAPRPLHRWQPSQRNADRRVRLLFPSTALFWWSGASRPNGRGSLMAYLPATEGHVPWYLELSNLARGWAATEHVGITEADAALLRRHAREGAA